MTELTDNIKELALIVRKAKASVFVMECISSLEPDDIDSDDIELRFEVDGRDTGTNVSIVDECGQAAKSICSLVEALEKAQQQLIDLFTRVSGESMTNYTAETLDWLADTIEGELDASEGALISARWRIAELEAQVEKLKAISAAAEKLVRCKGRYHSEQNYRALAALFGVNAPDLPPLGDESVTVKLPEVRITIAEAKPRNLTYQQLDAFNAGAGRAATRISQVLTAAGIKWEAE